MLHYTCISCKGIIREEFYWKKLLSFSIWKKDYFPPAEVWLCQDCLAKGQWLEQVESRCLACSRSLKLLEKRYIYSVEAGLICYDCYRWTEWEERWQMGEILSYNRSVLSYNEWAQEMIASYKFVGEERMKYFFASLLLGMLQNSSSPASFTVYPEFDYILPIPLSKKRLLERGFNQAGLVAELIAKELHILYVDNLLIRLDEEGKQSKKDREERLQEMFQKFIKNPESLVDIVDKRILLVDDIYTTGATLYSSAYALREAGAKQVSSITIAR